MLGLAVATAAGLTFAAAPPARRYQAFDTSDLDAMARVLRTHVAYVRARARPSPDQPLVPDTITGYGAVWGPREVVTLPHLVQDAARITIVGPQGSSPARRVRSDVDQRVAVLRTERPLAALGLAPAARSPPQERRVDMSLFALVSTDEVAGVVNGVLTELGVMPEYEGFPRTSLVLSHGMPIFDAYARLVGYSRVVAWDHDRHMLVPVEKIEAVISSADAPKKPATAQKPESPWWTR